MFELETVSAAIPTDETPDLDPAYTGNDNDDAPYGYTASGRPRKRPLGSRAGNSVPKQSGGSNEKLARQAAKTLIQLHETAAFPLHMLGLPATAAALSDDTRNEGFEEQLYAALLPDAALCRSITRFGGASARTSLVLAYAMFGMSIASVAYPEIREIQALRRAKHDK